jgi:hypothetical protein
MPKAEGSNFKWQQTNELPEQVNLDFRVTRPKWLLIHSVKHVSQENAI